MLLLAPPPQAAEHTPPPAAADGQPPAPPAAAGDNATARTVQTDSPAVDQAVPPTGNPGGQNTPNVGQLPFIPPFPPGFMIPFPPFLFPMQNGNRMCVYSIVCWYVWYVHVYMYNVHSVCTYTCAVRSTSLCLLYHCIIHGNILYEAHVFYMHRSATVDAATH